MELTREQQVKILNRAKKLLGPKGENWIKGTWFGKRVEQGPRGYVSDMRTPDSWCVLGALEEASVQLGIYERRYASQAIGHDTGLHDTLQRRKTSSFYPDVAYFNDRNARDFDDIKKLLNERLAELRKEKQSARTSKVPPK